MDMSEFLNDILRFCSLDTFDGSINVFNNFSKKLGELRLIVSEIGANVGKEVFIAIRDSLSSVIGIDPSRLDAGNATNNMSGQSKAAQSAMSGMPKMNNLVGGGSKSINDTDDSSKAKAAAQQKFAQDMQRQRNAAQ